MENKDNLSKDPVYNVLKKIEATELKNKRDLEHTKDELEQKLVSKRRDFELKKEESIEKSKKEIDEYVRKREITLKDKEEVREKDLDGELDSIRAKFSKNIDEAVKYLKTKL